MTTTTTRPTPTGSRFTEATREQSKLKMALVGPPNGGKSYTALRVSTLMVQAGLAQRIAVIETEAGKIKKYVGAAPDGIPFKFSLCVLNSYSPLEYVAAIEEAYNSGHDIIIIDSMSHAWSGKDGVLETVDATDGNSKFTSGWKIGTPMQNRFIDAVLQCPAHVLATIRAKVQYELVDEVNKNGQTVKAPKKYGMAPIQREGIEYEFEIVGFFDASHVMTITKSICEPIDNTAFVKPGPEFATPVIEWLKTGVVVNTPRIVLGSLANKDQIAAILESIVAARRKIDDERDTLLKLYGVREFHQLSYDQAEKYLARIKAFARAAQQKEAVAAAASGQQQAAPTPAPAAEPAATQPAAVAQNGEMTPEQHAQIDALVTKLAMAPAAVRKLVRDCGCKQGAVKKLTGEQANEVIRRLASGALAAAIVASARPAESGQTLQEALTTPAPADEGNGQPSTPPPNAYTNLAPLDFVVTAFSELALAIGWDKATENANFAAALARRGVNSVRALTNEQLTEFSANLVAKIKEVYTQRGQQAACPFPYGE